MLVDFDKVLIPKYKAIEENAVYSVAIFFATVIAVPFRAMNQIVAPITAKLMVEKKWEELNDLYKKTSINLQIAGGFIMLIIFVNVNEMYRIVPDDYSAGLWVVFMIGLSKYYDVLLGNNNSIIVNTHYYRTVLLFGVVTVVLMIVLNALFIPPYGINGSAFATLLTIMIYNTIKFFFVVKKMKLFPFTPKTLVSLAIVSVGFVLFYFWDFPFHPVLNIALKSILVTFYFVGFHYKMNVSTEVNQVIQKVAARFAIRM
jgi:O-antigen/teichoic acid export membrane protein